MRTFLLLLLSCAALPAADDIGVTTNVRTNQQTGRVIIREVFTRDGQTNLVRVTQLKDGVEQSCAQRFYYRGKHVADHMLHGDTSFLTTTAGFSLTLDFTNSNHLSEAYIGDRKGNILEAYTITNRMLVPVPLSELKSIRHSMVTRGLD